MAAERARRVGVALGVAALVALLLASCRAATEIDVDIVTDVPCDDQKGSAVTVGLLGAIETRPISTASDRCDRATGSLGRLVLAPSGDDSAEVSFKIVLGVHRTTEKCVAPAYEGCIVARRSLRFSPHTRLDLPVFLRKECLDVPCGPDETCVKGAVCVKARIPDPSRCATPGACGEGVLGGGAPRTTDAGDAGGGLEGGSNIDAGPGDAGGGTDAGCSTAACALPAPALALGIQHTCVARANGVVCLGTNVKAQLGRNAVGGLSETPSSVLTAPGAPLTGVLGVASGYDGSCGLLAGGAVSCWGDSGQGQLGTTGTLKVATLATAMQGALAIAPGETHACWIDATSGVRCLGKIGSTPAAVPRDMKLGDIVQIGSGIEYACALDRAGKVACWGANLYRQVQPALGPGGTVDTPEIVDVGGPAGQIVVGEDWACARVADQVKCWGNNQFEQLARPTSSSEAVAAVQIGGSPMTGVLALAAGHHFVCARRAADLMCWGANGFGMLGRGGIPSGSAGDHSAVPQAVVGLGGFAVVEIAGGRYHACARAASGETRCWGQGTEAQLGGPPPLENTGTPRKLVLP